MAGDLLAFTLGTAEELIKAQQVADTFNRWDSNRDVYKQTMSEIAEYIQATDTSQTENDSNGWNNITHIPKLAQIRDNLYANYQTGLFPNEQWLRWDYEGKKVEEAAKKQIIEGYMVNKVRLPEFRNTVNSLLLDYIDYGNAYAYAEYVRYTRINDTTGDEEVIYEGPVPRRIDPNDIVYNPAATSWEDTPCIVRSTMTEGDFASWLSTMSQDIQDKGMEILARRNKVQTGNLTGEDEKKVKKIELAGLGNLHEYLTGNLVDVLTFYGDIYNPTTMEVEKNKKIIVVDRMDILMDKDNPSWVGKPIVHAAWRRIPGNLMGMSVLENLIGMQYRINHLENMKADALDLNVYPPFLIKGNVPEFEWGPNCEIHIPDPESGSVDLLAPDLAAIQLDLEIQKIMDWMEEFAGTPKETLGFRTPGEKTAFEVQQLMSAAGRVFQEKITNFEVMLLEPLLNLMLSESRNNLTGADLALIFDDEIAQSVFVDVSASDIKTSGKLRPMGARHFAEQSQLVQNLVGIISTPLGPKILPHMAGTDIYKAIEDALGISKWQLFRENAGIYEAADQQQVLREAQARNNAVGSTEIG